MSWIERFKQHNTIKQYASVAEQALMSGSNMFASIVVLKLAGVSQFGIYSFIFVISTLIVSVFGTLLHRQMMLRISSEPTKEQRNIFLATIVIEIMGIALLLAFSIIVFVSVSGWIEIADYMNVAIAGILFTVLMILFDACKQYSYTTDNQPYSLRSTIIYIGSQLCFLALILWKVPAENVVSAIYFVFSVSLFISLAANRLCQTALAKSQWTGWRETRNVFSGYFEQGRFSLLGMAIAWIQNQSMNPVLMLVSGPTIAGYFSLGRLLIMPMAVVNQGLVNSSTPTLRRIFKDSGFIPLTKKIQSFLLITTLFSSAYVALLLIAHISGLFDRFIPEYSNVQWFLLLWVILVSCTMLRFWHGQFFVVSMQFKLLLHISIIALSVTALGFVIIRLGLNSTSLAICSVVAGELTAIALYLKYTKIQMKDASSTNQA